jgi:Phage tail lysozyme
MTARKQIETSQSVAETTPTRISELTKRLQELKKEVQTHPNNPQKLEEIRKTREELLSLQREFQRAKQYTRLSKEQIPEGRSTLDSIDASALLRIDKELSKETRWEFLSQSFLFKRNIDNEWNVTESPLETKSIVAWDEFIVDLGKNTWRKSAYWKIGLWDILPASIGYVSVNGVIWVRAIINGRVWYYTKPSPDGYIPVFTGTVVKIPQATDIWSFEKVKSPSLSRNIDQKESDAATDMRIERLERMPESSTIEVSILTRESYDFWKSKGLSEAAIAGLLANEVRESRCNPRAIGDNGKAHGIFQWHPDRRAKILSATGIDITSANHSEQLKAAWWEMTEDSFEKKVFSQLQSATTPGDAAAIISREYLRPGDTNGEQKVRAEYADNLHRQFRYINNPELASIPEGEANKKIIEFALQAQKNGDILGAIHCTDWVEKVCLQSIGRLQQNIFNGVAGTKIALGTGIHGNHASKQEVSIIQPGNHIMVDHMENGEFSRGRTHSVIALSRPIDGIVEVVSYPNGWILPRIEKYDLLGEWRAKNGKVLRIQSV